MEILDSKIQYYEQTLKKIPEEYNTSMLCEWLAIREKEVYFIRKLANLKNDKEKYKNQRSCAEK